MAQKMQQNDFIQATGDGLKMLMPKFELPEMELEWKVLQVNAFERNRGRAYGVAFTAAITMNMLLQAFDLWRKGETKAWSKFSIPQGEIASCGFTGGGPRLPQPSHDDGQGPDRELPDQHAVDLERFSS